MSDEDVKMCPQCVVIEMEHLPDEVPFPIYKCPDCWLEIDAAE